MEIKISDILKKYDTDKVKEHHYGEAYDHIFKRFDRKAKIALLEIGVQKGGSLVAWKEYYPNATIVGVDIEDQVIPEYFRKDVTYVTSDVKKWQTDMMFDIIIDDGSHLIRDVGYVVNHFSDHLKPGGVMIIEDVSNPELWIQVVMASLPSGFNISFKDLRAITNRGDDFLIIITKLHDNDS